MYIVVKNTLLTKMPKIYLFLCVCGRQEVFERDKLKQRIEEENAFLREDYQKCNL